MTPIEAIECIRKNRIPDINALTFHVNAILAFRGKERLQNVGDFQQNIMEEMQKTLIHVAIEANNFPALQALISAGAKTDIPIKTITWIRRRDVVDEDASEDSKYSDWEAWKKAASSNQETLMLANRTKNSRIIQLIQSHQTIRKKLTYRKQASIDDDELSSTVARLNFDDSPIKRKIKKEQSADYLYLDSIKGEYIIGCPPIKSSGDIYHILAYAILAKYHGKAIPHILLTYDKMSNYVTKLHTQRASGLAKLLGISVEIKEVQDRNSGQSSARLTSLKQYVKQRSQTISELYLIDQKATTMMIILHVQEYGLTKTQEILRAGFIKTTEAANKEYHKQLKIIHEWVERQMRKIHQYANGKPIIILNCRRSEAANNDQNFKAEEIELIRSEVESRGYCLWVLMASSEHKEMRGGVTYLFSTPFNKNFLKKLFAIDNKEDKAGLYKLRHIILLDKLLNLPNVQGMIGNTSGTLDIAAMMGFNVYDFHSFEKGTYVYLYAQDYRLLIQESMLSIGNFIRHTQGQLEFKHWLSNPILGHFPCFNKKITVQNKDKKYCGTQYATHSQRDPLSGCLTWNGTKTPATPIRRTPPGMKHIEYSFFKPMDARLRTKAYTVQTQAVLFSIFQKYVKCNAERNAIQITSIVENITGYAVDPNDQKMLKSI